MDDNVGKPEFESSNSEFEIIKYYGIDGYLLNFKISSQGFNGISIRLTKQELINLIKFLTISISKNYLPNETISYIGYDIKSGPQGYTKEIDGIMKGIAEEFKDPRVDKERTEREKDTIVGGFNLMRDDFQIFLTREKFMSFRKFCIGLKIN